MTTALQDAFVALRQASTELGVTPTDKALYWMLGLVRGESAFGTTPAWSIPDPYGLNTESTNPDGMAEPGPSHNWGAVKWSAAAGPRFILHHDKDANGVLGVYKFQRYTSASEGAKQFLRTLYRGDVPSIVQDPNTTEYDLAAAMYKNHYYTGTSGTAEDRIRAYGKMIIAGANAVRTALGAIVENPTLNQAGKTAAKAGTGIGTVVMLSLFGGAAYYGHKAYKEYKEKKGGQHGQ